MDKKKNLCKNIFKYSIFLILIIVTFGIVFKENDFSTFIDNLKQANMLYISLGVACMFIFILAEASNIKLILNNLKDKVRMRDVFRYSLVGFFFSSITPSSTGGQPAQIYFMSKDGVPVAHSTLALLVELMGYQLALGILAIIGFIINFEILTRHLGNIKFLVFLGMSINIVIIIGLVILIFSKSLALKIVSFLMRILNFFHYKKTDKLMEAVNKQIDLYHQGALYLKENKRILLRVLCTNLIQLSAYHAIPYFVYLSFGLHEISALRVISMQAVLYVAVAALPFPGSVGVSEGSFMVMFKEFFGATLLGSAMILSRGISFYLFVIISAIGVIVSFIHVKKINKTRQVTSHA